MSEQDSVKLVKSLKHSLLDLQAKDHQHDDMNSQKVLQNITQTLHSIEAKLYGLQYQNGTQILQQEIINNDILLKLVQVLPRLQPSDLPQVRQIFNILLRSSVTIEHISSKKEILFSLFKRYGDSKVALTCGKILRNCIEYEKLCAILLHHDEFYQLLRLIQTSNSEISTDALRTFECLLKTHKSLAATFFDSNFNKVFEHFNPLLRSDDHVIRQHSLRVLSELLQETAFRGIKRKYVSYHDNLKFTMNTLKSDSEDIQFEAFHMFKIFVIDPHKTEAVQNSLHRSKEKLLRFMSKFLLDRENHSQQFKKEKVQVIQLISEISSVDDSDEL